MRQKYKKVILAARPKIPTTMMNMNGLSLLFKGRMVRLSKKFIRALHRSQQTCLKHKEVKSILKKYELEKHKNNGDKDSSVIIRITV